MRFSTATALAVSLTAASSTLAAPIPNVEVRNDIVARATSGSSKDTKAFKNSLESWLGGQGPQALEPGTRPKPKPAPKPKGKRDFDELESRESDDIEARAMSSEDAALRRSDIAARATSSKDIKALNNSLESWLGGQGPQALEPGTRPKPKPAPKPKGKRDYFELDAREYDDLVAREVEEIVARSMSSADTIEFNNSMQQWLGGQGPQALEPGSRPKPKPAPKPKGKREYIELLLRELSDIDAREWE